MGRPSNIHHRGYSISRRTKRQKKIQAKETNAYCKIYSSAKENEKRLLQTVIGYTDVMTRVIGYLLST